MSSRITLAVVLMSIVTLLPSSAIAEQTEALLMYHQEGYEPYVPGGGVDPGTPIRLVAGEQDSLPQGVQDDITALNDAIMDQTGAVFRRLITSSPNGRTILATKTSDEDDDSHGEVWIWPDWRDADNLHHFPDAYAEARLLSNYHVLLHDGEWGDSSVYHILDWRQPDHLFAFTTDYRRATVRVAENGRWACETRDNALRVGMLDHEDENWIDSYVEIPIDAPIGEMTFLHGGKVLIMDVEPDDGEQIIRTYTFPAPGEMQLGAEHVGGVIYHWTTSAGNAHFFGRAWEGALGPYGLNAELVLFSVSESGDITAVTPVGYEDDYTHNASERPTDVSPSGKFARTQRRTEVGGVAYGMRRTPLADSDEPLPPEAPRNRPGPPVWVSWE